MQEIQKIKVRDEGLVAKIFESQNQFQISNFKIVLLAFTPLIFSQKVIPSSNSCFAKHLPVNLVMTAGPLFR